MEKISKKIKPNFLPQNLKSTFFGISYLTVVLSIFKNLKKTLILAFEEKMCDFLKLHFLLYF